MNITANRWELLSAAQNAEKIVPALTTLPILRCAYLATENGKLTVAACNLELALERRIPAEIREEGAIVLDAELLAAMLRLLSGETVTISQKDNGAITVTGGEATYHIPTMDAATYPRMEIPCPEDTVPVTGIPAMVKRTTFAVSEEEGKPQMKCVHLIFSKDGLKAVSSDGYRIAAAKGDSKAAGSVDMLLPATSLEKLAQLVSNKDSLRVGVAGKTMVFSKEDFAFSARIMEGSYFDADQLMSRVTPSFTVLTDTDLMKQSLASVNAVTGKQSRFSIAFNGSRLRMRCASESGASVVDMDVVPLSGTPEGEYWYDPVKLMECLRAQGGTLMLELAQNGALLMRTDDLVCLQMPMRRPKPIQVHQTETKAKTGKKKKKEDAALPEAA